MLSRLLRPLEGSQRVEHHRQTRAPPRSPVPGPSNVNREYVQLRHATADFTELDDDDEEDEEEEDLVRNRARVRGQYRSGADGGDGDDDDDDDEDEDGLPHTGNVLPLFSATHLDSLPVYSLVHAIRIIVQTRTETTLTWEQLRSPQVSQFLVKPMQQQIRTQHFSRATLYALMANCLQFAKEGQLFPGNAGTSSTRSKVCELLAIKLLKEYSTRELIDALSYDFYPLQGIPGIQTPGSLGGAARHKPVAARTSTLEVAIRAAAKRFLAHPLVVQHLEAIWNGAISFYSSADSLHRKGSAPPLPKRRGSADPRTPLLGGQSSNKETGRGAQIVPPGRRTVALYDPRNASLFKLSRLRVPRYRQFLSTCSLAVLIGLFLAVLIQQSGSITSLELVFWFWSAGFMLDELVGFNEQGFSLYIMSFWNLFDLGILLILIAYYCLRLYGVFMINPHGWNELAYNVLAANAILLLPRIFSVLDHYPFFSQLLIAFRLMALDLAAVLILVLISCSGFFVFFTLSNNHTDAGEVAYKIFQILMGFTPAAWEVWPQFDWLERTLMALFLVICHFVVVTILITVLTNSFMAIASNANEEHQYLFAINTISMVKNDALFSYIAPGNIFAWILMPLRYILPLRQFVSLNRLVIKLTHFPLLFCIYLYERFWLAPSVYEPTDLVDNPGRTRHRSISLDPTTRAALFSPNVRVREESVVGYQKDHALEEVFRRAPDMVTLRNQRRSERRKTQTAIRHWMNRNEGLAGSPGNYATMDSRAGSEWQRRLSVHRDGGTGRRLRQLSEVRSVASDPADLLSNADAAFPGMGLWRDGVDRRDHAEVQGQTDADGDDELVTNDEEEEDATKTNESLPKHEGRDGDADYFTTPTAPRFGQLAPPAPVSGLSSKPQSTSTSPKPGGQQHRRALHHRTQSSTTVLFNPPNRSTHNTDSSPSSLKPSSHPKSRPLSSRHTPTSPVPTTPLPPPRPATGHRSPRRIHQSARPRPIHTNTAPIPTPAAPRNIPGTTTPGRRTTARRFPSFATDLPSSLGNLPTHVASASAFNPSEASDDEHDAFHAVPASFTTQMALATGMIPRRTAGGRGLANIPTGGNGGSGGRGNSGGVGGDDDRMGRLVLARMKTLEESFADVVRGMKVLQASQLPSVAASKVGSAVGTSEDDEAGEGTRAVRRSRMQGAVASAIGGSRQLSGRGRGGKRRRTRTAEASFKPESWRSLKEEKGQWTPDGGKNKGKGRVEVGSDADDDKDDEGGDDNDPGEDDDFFRRGSSL